MSALEHLRTLAGGDRPENDGLLGNARCAWGRGEFIGEEGVLGAFCANPFAPDEDVLIVETEQGAALVGKDDALMADLYNGRIGRLWRVGRGIVFATQQMVDVAFDPDMGHERGDVYFRAEDHPELSVELGQRLLAAARAHVDGVRRGSGLRVRAFVVRAFESGDTAAGLIAVYKLSNEAARSAGFSYVVISLSGSADARVVSEEKVEREWTPRL
jgi:hypothetical protein